MNSILDYIFTLTESTLIFWLLESTMICRFSGLKKICMIIAAIIANTIVIHIMSDLSINDKFFVYFCFSLLLSQIIYKGKISIKAFLILVANYIFLVSDIIAGNFSSYFIRISIQNILYVSASPSSLSFSVLAKSLNIVFNIVCIYNFKNIKFKIPQKYLVIMDIIVFLFIVTLQFMMHISPILQKDSNNYSLYILGISLGLIIISGLNIFFLTEICFYHEKEKKNYELNARNHLLEQQLSYYESATSDLTKIRHDINNNLINISCLLKQNNIHETVTYINAITEALEGTKSVINCGNDIIDAILNYKIAVCKRHNIDININVDHVPHLSVSPIDLNAILANILDNAIEALELIEGEKRYITGKIFCYKNYLSIVVRNPYESGIRIVNNRIETHKQDKLHHGYGLTSIRSSAEKYGGSFNVYLKNNIFCVVVMLPIEINI